MANSAIVPENFFSHASFSPGIRAKGETIYVAGQLPLSPAGDLVGAGDIDAQIERVWVQMETILAAAGASLADVVKVMQYTTDVAYCPLIVDARTKRFAGLTPPASAMVVVAGLAKEGSLVEIEAVAVI